MTAAEAEQAVPDTPDAPASEDSLAENGPTTAENPPEDSARQQADWNGAEELKNIRRLYQVHNSFYGMVNADGATFGTAIGGRSSAIATGVLAPERVRRVLNGFVRPAAYTAALEVLRQRRLLVLVGGEGTGKQALALHLLRTVCGEQAELVAASPARSLGQLATLEFTPGSGILVADHAGSTVDVAERGFDADQLCAQAGKSRVHIVLTTTSRKLGPRYLPSYAVVMETPDPIEVLHAHLAGAAVAPDLLVMAEEFVRDEHRPREVAAMARCLVDSPSAAVASMRDVPRNQVSAWFDRPVKIRELVSITALAIGGSQPESIHDVLVGTLRKQVEAAREEREAAPHVPWHEEVLGQRTRAHDLVVVTGGDHDVDDDSDEDGWLSGRRVRFRHREYRELVLRELHERYDDQLWRPVGTWVNELCRIDPKEEIQTELAAALAILARLDFVRIRQKFLSPWAAGRAPERMTAAMVLWFMSEDDRLAPVALRTALEWGENQGLHRGVTSALALSGPLGVRFMEEALPRLCFLSLRAKRIGAVARDAVGVLLGIAVEDGSTATGRVLASVQEELNRATRRRAVAADEPAGSYVTEGLATDDSDESDPEHEQYEHGWNGRVAGAARSLVLAVLEAEQIRVPKPLAAKILCERPEHAEQLGTLWAEVLCSSPHRLAAIETLRRTLVALKDEPSAMDAVARFGTAVYSAMPQPHRPIRTAELMRAMTHPKREAERPAHSLVSTLLAALNAATPRSARS